MIRFTRASGVVDQRCAIGVPFEDKVGLGKPSENPYGAQSAFPDPEVLTSSSACSSTSSLRLLFQLKAASPSRCISTEGRSTSIPSFLMWLIVFCRFLQFGSPHSLGAQAQYVAAERSEVWVNIGYRLSAFGFLACDEPKISGNFGFKDQWSAMLWIRDNIASFGGE